jgi:transposase
MAKSALDTGRRMLKKMLEYKCDHAGIVFEEINEAHTTQACLSCKVIPSSGPKGSADLNVDV